LIFVRRTLIYVASQYGCSQSLLLPFIGRFLPRLGPLEYLFERPFFSKFNRQGFNLIILPPIAVP